MQRWSARLNEDRCQSLLGIGDLVEPEEFGQGVVQGGRRRVEQAADFVVGQDWAM
ncbi:hypothetical protein [Rhodococcus sp. 05-2255-1e]|uniref:hypothetical protein n=1 Tax=Rhodococcus sp. 05-2255-1e TaxID=2022495 RepID=UPI002795AEDA|nr:hypothetical protein [Rhodococcus sp. 05-2255-1e]